MQKMRDLAQARIDDMEEALFHMVGLFSADDMLLKGTDLHAVLKQARAALVTCRIQAIQRSTKKNITKLEELETAAEEARDAAGTSWEENITWAAWDDIWDAFHAARAAYDDELKKIQEENMDD
jgi:hypothetical protein